MENYLHSVDETVDIVAYIYFQRYANLLQNVPSEIFCLMFCEFAQSNILWMTCALRLRRAVDSYRIL